MIQMSDKTKKRVYEIIERSREGDIPSKIYDNMILIAIIVGLVPLTMKEDNIYTLLIDIITVLIFLVDYILRFYTSDYKMGVKSYKAYLAYAFTPLAIIDFLSIVPILSLFFPARKFIGLFRLFRILRTFRVVKLVRYSKTMVSLSNVGRKVKKPLTAVLVLTLIYICVCGLTIYQVEPDLFDTCFDAIYWATISITTIGYGDIAPITPIGRFITMVSSLVGMAVIALPSGIITGAYIEEIKKKKSKLEL